jgi:hypothetical protein
MTWLSTQSTERLMRTTSVAALVPAGVAGLYTHHFIKDALCETGFTGMASPLALAAAAGITACYGTLVHTLLHGVAPLPSDERAKAAPAIAAGAIIVLLGSAYPNVMVTGGGMATAIEDRAYIATVAEVGDHLKRAAKTVEQIDAVVTSDAAQLEAAARFEASGGLSGAPSQGVLAEAIRSTAQGLRGTQKEIAGTRERIGDEVARIDGATDKMRAALADRSVSLAERRTRMQRHGDEARSAAISIAALTPVAGLQALADRLTGPQLEPRWSQTPEIRKNQEEGFRKLKEELRGFGKVLARHTGDLAQSLRVTVPVYDPVPTSILVLKHAAALTSVFAFAFALDLLPLVLFAVACVMFDAARQREEGTALPPIALTQGPPADSKARTTLAIESDVGEHPHPTPSRARTNGSGRRPTGRDGGDERME